VCGPPAVGDAQTGCAREGGADDGDSGGQKGGPMGLRDRRRGGEEPARRYLMREKLLSVGDDYWIEDESGGRAFKVDGKAFRVRQTFRLEDASGDEVAKIQERKVSVRDKMHIDLGGRDVTVHKALVGVRDRYKIDVDGGPDLRAKGNFVDHEYEVERDGDTVATVSKRWFRVRETYGVEIGADEDVVLMLAISVCIDAMARD
jgi:uncharacterized protein YxjI